MLKTMHLFAGAGGGILADLILGHEPVVAIEWEPYACQVLREREADGWFPGMQVWEGDVRLFNPSEYKGKVDCINAGFPCQDISVAGNQAGIGEGTRSGLYKEVLRIADEIQPQYIFLENVAAIVNGNDGAILRAVIGDLAERGFDAVWCCLSAAKVGAKHKRDRWWLLGYSKSESSNGCGTIGEDGESQTPKLGSSSSESDVPNTNDLNDDSRRYGTGEVRRKQSGQAKISGCKQNVSNTERIRQQRPRQHINTSHKTPHREGKTGDAVNVRERSERQAKPSMGMLADDVAYHMDGWNDIEAQVGRVTSETQNRADKLKAIGNGQVPLQAAVAFSVLWEMREAANAK